MIKEISISQQKIETHIFTILGTQVMMDSDKADIYQETRELNQAVKRNSERFPDDFMFQLTQAEWGNLKSHYVTSSEQFLNRHCDITRNLTPG